MGIKSRSNYALSVNISQEEYDRIFSNDFKPIINDDKNESDTTSPVCGDSDLNDVCEGLK